MHLGFLAGQAEPVLTATVFETVLLMQLECDLCVCQKREGTRTCLEKESGAFKVCCCCSTCPWLAVDDSGAAKPYN